MEKFLSENLKKNTILAHVLKDSSEKWIEHDLLEHLVCVGKLAKKFADKFNNGDWAYLAGLWHDLGKYNPKFQSYIKIKSGYDPDAHLETNPGKVNHSSAGALHAIEKFGKKGRILAYLIAGHHAGLADWYSKNQGIGSLSSRLNEKKHLIETLSVTPPSKILNQEFPTSKPNTSSRHIHLWIRLLFSCLVDADFLDTEQFMDLEKSKLRSNFPHLSLLLNQFNQYMQKTFSKALSSPVNKIRSNILKQCKEKALNPSGIYSLNVPTGGGKTLSSLAFALEHAIHLKKDRVIYVIPYTSILEQTADIFRNIFSEGVVEHHSNLDSEKESPKSRLACENWDASIIVTTNVQFFESLFATRTSRCRKLHNIINSVVVLDEAQLFPTEFLDPILSVISELFNNYKVSFLISTATQPVFKEQITFDYHFKGLPRIEEIIEDPIKLHESLKRVQVNHFNNLQALQNWEVLAKPLKQHEKVLCIVNTRRDCRTLFRLMPEGTYHLSALMCGEHRSKIISEIKEKLTQNYPIRVISTQLVEAGVDFDFPVVYRALAGLDSIAQAAGRCNREGLLPYGTLMVFVPPGNKPPTFLKKQVSTALQIINSNTGELLSPQNYAQYFEHIYWKAPNLDAKGILQELKPGQDGEVQFRTAAQKFKLIEDDFQKPIIVIYRNEDLINQLREKGPERKLLRSLQRYVVNIQKIAHDLLLNKGDIEELHPGIFVQINPGSYDQQFGFVGDIPEAHDPNDYMF